MNSGQPSLAVWSCSQELCNPDSSKSTTFSTCSITMKKRDSLGTSCVAAEPKIHRRCLLTQEFIHVAHLDHHKLINAQLIVNVKIPWRPAPTWHVALCPVKMSFRALPCPGDLLQTTSQISSSHIGHTRQGSTTEHLHGQVQN